MMELSYYDYLLRTIATGQKRTEGQWNRLIQEALAELNSLINKEGTTYDSTVMLTFQEYQGKLSSVAKEKLGIEIDSSYFPKIFVGNTSKNNADSTLPTSHVRNVSAPSVVSEKKQVTSAGRTKR